MLVNMKVTLNSNFKILATSPSNILKVFNRVCKILRFLNVHLRIIQNKKTIPQSKFFVNKIY